MKLGDTQINDDFDVEQVDTRKLDDMFVEHVYLSEKYPHIYTENTQLNRDLKYVDSLYDEMQRMVDAGKLFSIEGRIQVAEWLNKAKEHLFKIRFKCERLKLEQIKQKDFKLGGMDSKKKIGD